MAPTHRWLTRLTRRLPPRGAAKSLAHILRRIFILTHRAVADDEIDGLRLRAHLLDNVSERRYFFMPQLYDRTEYDFIRETFPRGGHFVDIGANAGLYSLWAGAAAGPEGRVLAIEPNPVMIARLRFNILANAFEDRIEVLPVAVGDNSGERRLGLDPSNLGGASLEHGNADSVIRVPVRPLMTILEDSGFTDIDIMKLDIEGHEDTVLLPFLCNAPERLLPRAIIIEDSRNLWRVDLLSRLEETGYRRHLRGRLNFVLIRP